MNTIKETVIMAKKGNQQCKQILKEHYEYIIDLYYEKYKDKISRKELKVMYDIIINDFYNEDLTIPLVLYIHKKFTRVLHRKFDKKDIEVKNTVILACQGNIEARNKLINHFSPLVYKIARKYDYMDYEELVQYGIIKLIETIDNLIKEHPNESFFTNSLPRTIEIYFNSTLRKKVLKWETDDYLLEDDFLYKSMKIELEDFINNYPCVERNKQILKKHFFDKDTLQEIGDGLGVSRELVRKTIEGAREDFIKVR